MCPFLHFTEARVKPPLHLNTVCVRVRVFLVLTNRMWTFWGRGDILAGPHHFIITFRGEGLSLEARYEFGLG